MGILAVAILTLRFIHAKNDQTSLTNFNISVTVTDLFMDASTAQRGFRPNSRTIRGHGCFRSVTGKDYAVYRRPDGTTVTFADKLAFETADLTDCLIEEPPMPGMVFAPTSGIGLSLRRINTPSRALSL